MHSQEWLHSIRQMKEDPGQRCCDFLLKMSYTGYMAS